MIMFLLTICCAAFNRHLDLEGMRAQLKPFYSGTGRPSVDTELMMRMLIIGYCMGIRSERPLCEEVHLNLAYRWFCRLDLDGKCRMIPASRRTGMAASGKVTSCAICSKRWWSAVWLRAWSGQKGSPLMLA